MYFLDNYSIYNEYPDKMIDNNIKLTMEKLINWLIILTIEKL